MNERRAVDNIVERQKDSFVSGFHRSDPAFGIDCLRPDPAIHDRRVERPIPPKAATLLSA
jgi:hypothetical protein